MKLHSFVAVSAVAFAAIACAPPDSAPFVPHEVSCPECDILVTKVATLDGNLEGPLACDYWSRVASDSRGRLYVAPNGVFIINPTRSVFLVIGSEDGANGQLIAQRRIDTVFERFIGHQMMYSLRGLPDGNFAIDVWRFELVVPT